jgi:carbon starvation protein
LFGTANQLLAALTLVGVTVWLVRTGKTWWYTAIPAVFMMAVTFTSLGMVLWDWLKRVVAPSGDTGLPMDRWFVLNAALGGVLLLLAVCVVVEALHVMRQALAARRAVAGMPGPV